MWIRPPAVSRRTGPEPRRPSTGSGVRTGFEGTFGLQLANGHHVQVYVKEAEQNGSPETLTVTSDDPKLRYQVLGWRGHRQEEEPTVNDHQWPRITFWDGDYANSAAELTTTP